MAYVITIKTTTPGFACLTPARGVPKDNVSQSETELWGAFYTEGNKTNETDKLQQSFVDNSPPGGQFCDFMFNAKEDGLVEL